MTSRKRRASASLASYTIYELQHASLRAPVLFVDPQRLHETHSWLMRDVPVNAQTITTHSVPQAVYDFVAQLDYRDHPLHWFHHTLHNVATRAASLGFTGDDLPSWSLLRESLGCSLGHQPNPHPVTAKKQKDLPPGCAFCRRKLREYWPQPCPAPRPASRRPIHPTP